MIDNVVEAACQNPLDFACALAIIMLTLSISLGIFIKLAGNPISYIIEVFSTMIPTILKELRGKAGPVGMINALLVLLSFLLALAFIIAPNLPGILGLGNKEGVLFSFLICLLTFAIFYASLRIVEDGETMKELYKPGNK